MTGFFYILLFYFLGEAIALLINNYIPGCVIGMILLFIALTLKILSPSKVEFASKWLMNNMVIFFLPASVGLTVAFKLFAQHWLAIILAAIISTILTMGVVGWLQQTIAKKR